MRGCDGDKFSIHPRRRPGAQHLAGQVVRVQERSVAQGTDDHGDAEELHCQPVRCRSASRTSIPRHRCGLLCRRSVGYGPSQRGAGWNLASTTTTSPSGNSIVLSSNGAKYLASLPDYADIYQPIEGQRVADLQWGTANAKQIVVRFWSFYASGIGGTGYFCIQNAVRYVDVVSSFITGRAQSGKQHVRLSSPARQQAYGLPTIPELCGLP